MVLDSGGGLISISITAAHTAINTAAIIIKDTGTAVLAYRSMRACINT